MIQKCLLISQAKMHLKIQKIGQHLTEVGTFWACSFKVSVENIYFLFSPDLNIVKYIL